MTDHANKAEPVAAIEQRRRPEDNEWNRAFNCGLDAAIAIVLAASPRPDSPPEPTPEVAVTLEDTDRANAWINVWDQFGSASVVRDLAMEFARHRIASSAPDVGQPCSCILSEHGDGEPMGGPCPACVAARPDSPPATGGDGGEREAVARLKPGYPDYVDDPDGLARFRQAVRTNSGHDMAAVNHNSLGRLIDTIERLRAERDAALRAPADEGGRDRG